MAIKFSKKPAQAQTTVETKTNGQTVAEENTTETVDVPAEVTIPEKATEPGCLVGVEMSYTHNLGNYQSARVQVSLSVPCPSHDIDGVFDFTKDWVETKLASMVNELQAEG